MPVALACRYLSDRGIGSAVGASSDQGAVVCLIRESGGGTTPHGADRQTPTLAVYARNDVEPGSGMASRCRAPGGSRTKLLRFLLLCMQPGAQETPGNVIEQQAASRPCQARDKGLHYWLLGTIESFSSSNCCCCRCSFEKGRSPL